MPFIKMTKEYANKISLWQYDGEYAVYSFAQNDETIDDLCNGDYYAFVDNNKEISGYLCSGKSAQVPLVEANRYSENLTDIGIGMRPDLCGKGNGRNFFKEAVTFIKGENSITGFRLTVAVFNKRAIHLYEKLNFRCRETVTHAHSHKQFIIMSSK